MKAGFWARLGLIDVVMLTASAAGAVWLVARRLTGMHTSAALMLAATVAVLVFTGVQRRRRQ